MKKTDLLNAIDAWADSQKVASHTLKELASKHLETFLEKLPNEIPEYNPLAELTTKVADYKTKRQKELQESCDGTEPTCGYVNQDTTKMNWGGKCKSQSKQAEYEG